MPVAGAAEPLELVLADETPRAAGGRHDDRPRAGQHRRARRPERVARARAHLPRRQRRRGAHRGRGLERRHDRRRRRDHRGDAAARRRTGCRSAGRRCASSAAATRPRPAGRSWCKPGASLVVPSLGPPGVEAAATQFGMKPRVRSGYALKRLDASEGAKRWVLRDLNRGTFLRLSDNDAQLFELFDGTHSLSDLIGIAEQRFGPAGRAAARAAAGRPRRARLPGRGRAARTRSPRSRRASSRSSSSRARRRSRASAAGSSGCTAAAAGCCSRSRRCPSSPR